LESLRNKNFSHSSINETAKELGNVSRTLISENYRGLIFKYYVESNFNLGEAVNIIANTEDEEIKERIKAKAERYLSNIKKDIIASEVKDFNKLKEKFSSKYKNLPQKFHPHLDKIIKRII